MKRFPVVRTVLIAGFAILLGIARSVSTPHTIQQWVLAGFVAAIILTMLAVIVLEFFDLVGGRWANPVSQYVCTRFKQGHYWILDAKPIWESRCIHCLKPLSLQTQMEMRLDLPLSVDDDDLKADYHMERTVRYSLSQLNRYRQTI